MYRILFVCLLVATVAACGENATNGQETQSKNTTEEKDYVKVPVREGEVYPSVSQETMTRLGKECDHLDYTFLELPFSMS
ncbi:MAG: hypothetical protein AAF738_00375, partial [Bacteroidota bacterium]